jgi:predicted DNA-binding transcriptional regulator AlpA
MIEDRTLTAKEILELYPNKFSLTTLWRLAKKGQLRHCGRAGLRKRVWRQSAIEAFLTRDEPETISE